MEEYDSKIWDIKPEFAKWLEGYSDGYKSGYSKALKTIKELIERPESQPLKDVKPGE